MEVSEAIRTKRQIRHFKDEPVPEDATHTILNAGRRAPTAGNSQHITFIVVQDKQVQGQLATLASGDHVRTAPLVILIASSAQFDPQLVGFDIGQAASYMMLQAWEMGVASGVAGIRDQDKARDLLKVPSGVSLGLVIAFGYPLESDVSAPMKASGRKPLDEIVKWGQMAVSSGPAYSNLLQPEAQCRGTLGLFLQFVLR